MQFFFVGSCWNSEGFTKTLKEALFILKTTTEEEEEEEKQQQQQQYKQQEKQQEHGEEEIVLISQQHTVAFLLPVSVRRCLKR